MIPIFLTYIPNVFRLMLDFRLINLCLVWVEQIHQSMKFAIFINSGIISKPGVNLVNMMNMILKKLKTGTNVDGWNNKTKVKEKNMTKKSENVLLP